MALIFPDGSYTTNELPAGGITTLPGANTTVANPNYADLVAKQYATLGRTGIGEGQNQIDQEGFNYWTNQLASGALTPDQFQSSFKNAAENVYINQAYQDLFGRSAEPEGLQYWTGALDTTNKEDIYNAIKSGARGQDLAKAYGVTDTDISGDITAGDIRKYVTENINDPYAIYSAAEKYKVDPETIIATVGWQGEDAARALKNYNLARTVEQEYKDIGRGLSGDEAIDKEGFNYWYNQLQSGNITPEQFEKTFLTAAADVVGKGGAGSKVAANTVVEALSKGYDVGSAIDKANPLDVYELLGSRGLTTQDILGKNPNLKQADVDAYMAKIPSLYGTSVDQSITNVLGADAASSLTAEKKQNIIDNLVSGKTSREEVLKMLQESGANKNQEASRIANLYVQAFGGDAEDAKALYAKLTGATYTGTGKVDPEIYNRAKEKFDKALTSESEANAGITSLIKEAANTSGAETRKFFTDNPDLLTVYKDVGETKAFSNAGTGGQYGYYKGIPVLKASEVDEVFDKMGTDYIQGNAPDRLDNDIGWDTGSLSAVEARGAAALGVRKQDGGTDPETGQTYPATYTGDMTKLAAQLGIDPTKYKDTYKTVKTIDPETGRETEQQVIDKRAEDQLYDALNEKAKDFYFIAGKTGSGKTNDRGETSAFTRNDVSGNHAAVLYKKVGDKLIPIEDTLKYYNGQMELSPGSWFSQTFGGLASIPGIAELSLLIPGVGPGTYAAIKAAQTAALGGDLGDVAKAGALSYAGAKYLPTVTSGISEGLSGAGVTNELLNKTLTGATVSGGIAGLTGKDIGPAALMGGAGGALSYGASNLVPKEGLDFANQLGIDPKYQSLFANTLARLTPTILTGGKVDPTKVLMAYMMNQAKGAAKQQVKGTT